MNNHVGTLKKAAKRTQLKFRYSSLKPNERLRAKMLQRLVHKLIRTYAILHSFSDFQ